MTDARSAPPAAAPDPGPGGGALQGAELARARREELAIGLVLVVAAGTFPVWRPFEQAWTRDLAGLRALSWPVYLDFVSLALGLLLALPTRERSGLRFGSIRQHWRRVLLVCALPPLITALVYPRLPVRPFADHPWTMWAVSPLAQDLVFVGYLYGRLERVFPAYLHPRVPVRWALALTVAFFALWHSPALLGRHPGYALFQLFYTSVPMLIPALARQWTGSMLPVWACHAAVNWIAWRTS